MSARKDFDKLLRKLRHNGWKVEQTGDSVAEATHCTGAVVRIVSNHPSIHHAQKKIRAIEQHHEESQRQKIRAQNAGQALVPRPKLFERFTLTDTHTATVSRSGSTEKMEPKFAANHEKPPHKDDALLGLLADMDEKLKALGEGFAVLAGAVAAIGTKVGKICERFEEEQQRKLDQAAFDRRMSFLEAELKDLPVQKAHVLTFENEAELVATTKLVLAYGNNNKKEFRTTRDGLHVSVWRVR